MDDLKKAAAALERNRYAVRLFGTAAEAAAKREGRGAGALLPLGRGGLPEVPGARPLSLWPDCAAALAGEGAFPIRTLTAEELAK